MVKHSKLRIMIREIHSLPVCRLIVPFKITEKAVMGCRVKLTVEFQALETDLDLSNFSGTFSNIIIFGGVGEKWSGVDIPFNQPIQG